MNIPILLLGFLVSTLYGAAFHLIFGGGAGRLLIYLFLGWAGFWTGQLLSSQFGWTIGTLGTLHLGIATLSSLIFLGLGHWLSLSEAGG